MGLVRRELLDLILLPTARAEAAARWKLRACAAVGDAPTVIGRVSIVGAGAVRLGNRVVLDGSIAPIELHAFAGATIVIGDDCLLQGGTSLEAQDGIFIGDRVALGPFCKVMDSHFHATRDRDAPVLARAVVVEHDVELGPRTILLPGVHVGAGAVVSAGSVVHHAVSAGAYVRGVPAKAAPKATT